MPQARSSTLAVLAGCVVAACSTFRTEHETGAARRAPASTSLATPRAAPPAPPRAGDFTQLVSAELAGCDLAVDAASVYFVAAAAGHAGGTLARVPKAGGPIEILTPKQVFVDDFALQGDTVFFAEKAHGALSRLSLRDKVSQLLVDKPPGLAPFPGLVGELVASSSHLFWSDARDLMTARLQSADVLWLPGVETSDAFAADERFVYFGADGDLVKAALPHASKPPTGRYPWPRRSGLRFAVPSEPMRLTSGGNSLPTAIVLDENSAVFTNSKALLLVAKSGSAPKTLLSVSSDEHFLTQRDQPLALDAARVYTIVASHERYAPNPREGAARIVSVTKRGAEVRELAQTPSACGVAVDDGSVYVATRHIAHDQGPRGSLLRLAKVD